MLEHRIGFEPMFPAWQASVLNRARRTMRMVGVRGFEPLSSCSQGKCLRPLGYTPLDSWCVSRDSNPENPLLKWQVLYPV